ncbi:MAG: undecaprenyl-phosphate glucose phosphotransferase [Rhodocyclaceae bacterium]|nr:undecaprenyl-phosphate glucose phosphotransferase [Rhodocyclaceae bacterium]
MFAVLDRNPGFLRASFTLPRMIEAFLDPVVVAASLLLCASAFGQRFSAPYVILALMAFSLSFPGNVRLHDGLGKAARKIFVNWSLFVLILGGFGVASGYHLYFPREVLIAWGLATPLALLASHVLVRLTLPRVLAISHAERRAVVAGVNEIGIRVSSEFRRQPFLGTKFVGFFDDRARERLPEITEMPLLGRLSELADFVKRNDVDAIYLALPMATQPRILSVLDDLKDTTASIYFVPDIFVTDLIQGRLDYVSGMPVVAVCDTPFTGVNGLVKRSSDVLLSLLILLLISPVLLVTALGVKLTSPGPVIFRQRRYGLDGKEIVVYKFRSMTVTEDGDKCYTQVTRNDSRVTPFGAFIRRTSLDELPQFINVLQGRMSIVGPRPHAVAVNEGYRKLIPGYMVRHKVKPGITGWAQVNGFRGGDDLHHMTRRIEYDLEYLRNWSLTLDLWIVFKTVWVVFRDRHAY